MGVLIEGQSQWGDSAKTLPVLFPKNRDLAKGWLNYLQTTDTERDSFNVSGVTDNSPGDFTVTWDTDFANVNYVICGIGNHNLSTNQWSLHYDGDAAARLVGSIVLNTVNNTPAITDSDQEGVSVIAFGDQ